jgi:hypothetical protein
MDQQPCTIRLPERAGWRQVTLANSCVAHPKAVSGFAEPSEVPQQRVAADPIYSQVLDRDTLNHRHRLDSRLDHLLNEQDVTPPAGG